MTRRRVGSLAVLLFPVAAKVLWMLAFFPDAPGLIGGGARADLLARYAYVAERVKDDPLSDPLLPPDPRFSGEWAIVALSMTAGAAVQFALAGHVPVETARADLDAMIVQALRPEIREFDRAGWAEDPLASLAGTEGHVGYLGHLGMILGARRVLGGDVAPEVVDRHRAVVHAIVRRAEAGPHPFLFTYPGECYTADNAVAMAAVAVYDLVEGDDHTALYAKWVAYAEAKLLDPATGLLVSGVRRDGEPSGPGRGSWAGWNSYYLPFFAGDFADRQWAAAGALVQPVGLGLVALREFPPGVSGSGDVDSGPVIFGLSPSGTGFAIAGARRREEVRTLRGFLLTAEGAGFSWQSGGRRHYLLAPVVGDAAILAMKTAQPWTYAPDPPSALSHVPIDGASIRSGAPLPASTEASNSSTAP